MDRDNYHKVLKHQSQLLRLEHTIQRCKNSLLDVQNLLDSLRESNKELMDTAKTENKAKPYNRKLYAPPKKSSASTKKQNNAKPNNRVKQYSTAAAASQRSTSSRKQDTNSLENLFKNVCIQDKHFERHPMSRSKK